MTIIQHILNQDRDDQQLGMTKMHLEMMQTIEFENTLQERVQELNLKLKESNNLRESDILINEIDTLSVSSRCIKVQVFPCQLSMVNGIAYGCN